VLDAADRAALENLDSEGWWQMPDQREAVQDPLMRAAAYYFLHARNARGTPVDAVARFHLGNGARLEQINFLGDASEKGIQQAHGMMVNYLYDLDYIERNHEAYAQNRAIAASSTVRRMVRAAPAELVPLD
jgi:malonyl-CoA decarboxylase